MFAVLPPRGPPAPCYRTRLGRRIGWWLYLPAPAPYRGPRPSSPARAPPLCATWIAKAFAPATSSLDRDPASPRIPEAPGPTLRDAGPWRRPLLRTPAPG